MKTFTCPGFRPVQAHTKSEARAVFKAHLRDLEKLKFRPQKVTRLPVGTKVQECP